MCLAIPMRVVEVGADGSGVVALGDLRQGVILSLVEEPECGDYVIVHAGFAIEKLHVAEAEIRLRLFDELARHHREETGETICWVPSGDQNGGSA